MSENPGHQELIDKPKDEIMTALGIPKHLLVKWNRGTYKIGGPDDS